jgi:hypothetical protein
MPPVQALLLRVMSGAIRAAGAAQCRRREPVRGEVLKRGSAFTQVCVKVRKAPLGAVEGRSLAGSLSPRAAAMRRLGRCFAALKGSG